MASSLARRVKLYALYCILCRILLTRIFNLYRNCLRYSTITIMSPYFALYLPNPQSCLWYFTSSRWKSMFPRESQSSSRIAWTNGRWTSRFWTTIHSTRATPTDWNLHSITNIQSVLLPSQCEIFHLLHCLTGFTWQSPRRSNLSNYQPRPTPPVRFQCILIYIAMV